MNDNPTLLILDDPVAPNADDRTVIDLTARIHERHARELARALEAELQDAGVSNVEIRVTPEELRQLGISDEDLARIAGAKEGLLEVELEKLHEPAKGRPSIAVVPAAALALLGDTRSADLERAMSAMDPAARSFFDRSLDAAMPAEVEAAWDRPGRRLAAIKHTLEQTGEKPTRAVWIHCLEAIAADEGEAMSRRAMKRALKIAAAEAKRDRKRKRNKRLAGAQQ